MSSRTILLVEDELLIRTMMTDVLRDAGYEVTEACDGDQGLEVLTDGEFDLLITDVKMPGSLDGLQLAAHWRARFPHRPVLVSSAHLRPDQLHLSDGLITKPFRDSDLLQTVARLIETPNQAKSSALSV